jgi:hypothetical protein
MCSPLLSQLLGQRFGLLLPEIARTTKVARLCSQAIGIFLERHVLGFPTLSTCEKMLGEDPQWGFER